MRHIYFPSITICSLALFMNNLFPHNCMPSSAARTSNRKAQNAPRIGSNLRDVGMSNGQFKTRRWCLSCTAVQRFYLIQAVLQIIDLAIGNDDLFEKVTVSQQARSLPFLQTMQFRYRANVCPKLDRMLRQMFWPTPHILLLQDHFYVILRSK